MSFESEMTNFWGSDVMVRVSNPGDPDIDTVNSTKVAQVLRMIIGEFERLAGITVTENDITSTELYLAPALNRGLFHLQRSGGKVGPPQDDKATIEEIRAVTHSNTLIPTVGTFEETEGIHARESDPYFPDSFLGKWGFPPSQEVRTDERD